MKGVKKDLPSVEKHQASREYEKNEMYYRSKILRSCATVAGVECPESSTV